MVKNWCKEHKQIWFKKGAMKGFAHPIKDGDVTTGWCNRPQDYEEPEEEMPKTETTQKEVKEIPGQQIGMTVKELGDMMRANILTKIFGEFAASNLITWYRSQILGTTKVPFDGAKLPNFEAKKKVEP